MNPFTSPPVVLLEAADAARLLNVSPARVRALCNSGDLPLVATTCRGSRLLNRADVLRLAARRAGR